MPTTVWPSSERLRMPGLALLVDVCIDIDPGERNLVELTHPLEEVLGVASQAHRAIITDLDGEIVTTLNVQLTAYFGRDGNLVLLTDLYAQRHSGSHLRSLLSIIPCLLSNGRRAHLALFACNAANEASSETANTVHSTGW